MFSLTGKADYEENCETKMSDVVQDHLVCVSCGSGNPAHTSRCLTCDGHLQQVRLQLNTLFDRLQLFVSVGPVAAAGGV